MSISKSLTLLLSSIIFLDTLSTYDSASLNFLSQSNKTPPRISLMNCSITTYLRLICSLKAFY